jgi:arginyl-tRNA synthetase
MQTVLSQLDTAFRAAIAKALGRDADPLVNVSQNEKFGDYQSNAAMGLAKSIAQESGQKTSPQAVAKQIIAALDLADLAEEPTIAGPGFINVRLRPDWVAGRLLEFSADPRLGIARAAHPQTVVVDYSGPNVAKQMHVGHLRSTIIGDAIARVLEFQGNDVIRQNHIGDWGTQFGMLIAYLQHAMKQVAGSDSATAISTECDDPASPKIADLDRFYKEARRRFDDDSDFADTARQTVVKLQTGSKEELDAWRAIVEESRRHFQPIYEELGVALGPDDERGESFYNSRLAGNVADLRRAGVAVESEGAIVAFTAGSETPLILEKTGGGFGYATTDLAAIRYRVGELKADRVIYFVGATQAQHFRQVFEIAQKSGWAGKAVLEHASFGSVLGEDGKMFKARSGESVKLQELIDEAVVRANELVEAKSAELPESQRTAIAHAVGIGAIKYADLSKDRSSDYVFSWEKMLALDGNTAPYLQYAYARIESIFRKAGGKPTAWIEPPKLQSPFELALAKQVLRLGHVIELVARELRPHYLATYLYELATKFSAFYENCEVLKSPEPTRTGRLLLSELTGRTMALGLDLLGIEHPEQM